jgi:hypothetical protein
MSEYRDFIRKEKEEALRDYDEHTFRLELNRRIGEETKPSHSYVNWFRRPAIAGSSVLLIIFLGWLTAQFFHPSSQRSEAARIKNTLVQLFTQHGIILDQSLQPIEQESDESAIEEFEWTVKRVLYAIQRENAPDIDITENLSRILQNTATLLKTGKNNNDKQDL